MRILHVRTVNGTGGGPDKTILNSCKYLARQGHVAEAFYMVDRRNDVGNVSDTAQRLGVTLHVSRETGPISPSTLISLYRVLKNGHYDLLHTHDYKANALAALFRRIFGYEIVATAHGYNRTSVREIFYYGLERFCFRFVEAVIAPSNEMLNFLKAKGISSFRLYRIPNGIETADRDRPFRRRGDGGLRLVFLGRLSREKGLDNLIDAIKILQCRKVNLTAVLVGEGPEKKIIEAKINELNLVDVVKMAGFVSDVVPFLSNADVLVNPSRTECMPNSILEAMWYGVPVVATAVGGVTEMIRDGVDGLLCPSEDPQALADAIERLAGNPELAQPLADRAYRRVCDEFSFEKHMRETVDLYRRLVDTHE